MIEYVSKYEVMDLLCQCALHKINAKFGTWAMEACNPISSDARKWRFPVTKRGKERWPTTYPTTLEMVSTLHLINLFEPFQATHDTSLWPMNDAMYTAPLLRH